MNTAFTVPQFWTVYPRANFDEGPQGYLLRLLGVNGLTWQILRHAIVAKEGENKWRLAARKAFVDIGRQKLPVGYDLIGRSKKCLFCPDCLSDAHYWRYVWELKLFFACHIHGKKLISCCQVCGDPIEWTRSNLKHCNCGAPLSGMHAEPASKISTLVAGLMYKKIFNIQRDCPIWLDELTPCQALVILSLMENFFDKYTGNNCSYARLNTPHSVHDAIKFERCIEVAPLDLITTLFHCVNAASSGDRPKFAAQVSAAFYDKNITTLTSLLEKAIQSTTHDLHELFRAQLLKNEEKACRDNGRSMYRIGLQRNQITELLRYAIDGGHAQYVGLGASRFLQSIEAKTASLNEVCIEPEHHIALCRILAPGERLFRRHAQLIEKVLDGRVSPSSRLKGFDGISAWVLSKDDLYKVWPTCRLKPRMLSLTSVARILGVMQPVARMWETKNYLKSESREKVPLKVIAIDSLQAFQTNFVTANVLGRYLNMTSAKVAKILALTEIHPISGPSIDGCSRILYQLDLQLIETVIAKFQCDLPVGIPWADWGSCSVKPLH